MGGQRFTEFYVLGLNGKAAAYPTHFIYTQNYIISVPNQQGIYTKSESPTSGSQATQFMIQYGADGSWIPSNYGYVLLTIVNREEQTISYVVKMQIDSIYVSFPFQNENVNQIGPFKLLSKEKWQNYLGIMPQHVGHHQKVNLELFKFDSSEPNLSLCLWIDVE
jgi:uncharacterized membrane protein